jgi:hypothetical protein
MSKHTDRFGKIGDVKRRENVEKIFTGSTG